jgi:hypothetical protein
MKGDERGPSGALMNTLISLLLGYVSNYCINFSSMIVHHGIKVSATDSVEQCLS